MRYGIAAVLFVVAGCAHHQTQEAKSATAPASATIAPASTAQSTPQPATCSVDLDCKSGQLCMQGRCADAATLPECTNVAVHFDFDRAELHADEQAKLDTFARCIKAQPSSHFTVAGNCDERGTEEYNLALGDKRARSVAEYLERQGVTSDRLRTVSYGKERPICGGHEESCWSKNRRAELRRETAQASR